MLFFILKVLDLKKMIIIYNIDNIFIFNCKFYFYLVMISFKFLINFVYILYIMVSLIFYIFYYDNIFIILIVVLNIYLIFYNRFN